MREATAIVHVSPAAGAAFVQYTAEFETGGQLGPTTDQRFLYVVDGVLSVDGKDLGAGGFAYLSPVSVSSVVAKTAARAAVIEKPYQALTGAEPPATFTGREALVRGSYLGDDPWLEVRGLIPDDRAFDF